jgi:hypothetical protein
LDRFGAGLDGGIQNFHDEGRKDVHAEEAEIVAGSEAGNEQALFGFGGRGFFGDVFDLVEVAAAGHAASANRAEVREFAFAGGLDGGDSGGLRGGDGNKLRSATDAGMADVEVIADEVEEGIVAGEGPGTPECVAVAEGFRLGDEPDWKVDGGAEDRFVAGGDDDGDVGGTSGGGFLGEDLEGGFRRAIGVHEALEGEFELIAPSGGDDGLGDFHVGKVRELAEMTSFSLVKLRQTQLAAKPGVAGGARLSCNRRPELL